MIKNIFKKFSRLGRTKMTILVRTDLNMGRGKIASQVAHAAVLLYESSLHNSNPYLKTWLATGQPKIVLKIDQNCTSVIENIYQNALKSNLNVCKVYDSGRTQVATGTLTAIGVGPNRTEDIDEITNEFKLLYLFYKNIYFNSY